MSIKRRFTNEGEAAKEIFDGFNSWSQGISSYSIQTIFAIIAANWAVYKETSDIISNENAKWSVLISIGFLGLNLLLTGAMTLLYNKRINYIDGDKDRWAKEFEAAEKLSSPWPYNNCINNLGLFIHIIKIVMPITAGILFILSVY
ncbi:MAG: hypothetical protein LHV68_12830 [Elusimicrobia bacterium]|nr:hypothetical protein [Candidatus Liberimonas magnetica]